jgi:hypothetical protein
MRNAYKRSDVEGATSQIQKDPFEVYFSRKRCQSLELTQEA